MYDSPEEVTFHPWYGARYGRESCFGVCLLVLGKFHYNDKAPDDCHWGPDFTQKVVRESGQDHAFCHKDVVF